ncbi:MAG TPA: ABC transporter permease [Burkholderiaceae bacterium]|nr:ABC transporter permease [Burkholderiaceae bacterium]
MTMALTSETRRAATPTSSAGSSTARMLGRHRGLLIAVVVFAVLLATVASIGSVRLTYFDLASIATSGATLAIAAIGQTLVILSGGFDLSAGAVVSLVNVVLSTAFVDPATATPLVVATGVGVGMLAGAFNGIFIAGLRMQPIVVTLSTMFILQGVTLLVMDKPGGAVPPGLAELLLGDALPNLLPRPLLLIGLLLLAWAWLKRTRFGMAMYAVGSDVDSARAAGVSTRFVQFMVYLLAGGCYGLAGVFVSAQTGSGDPLIGAPLLLQMFAAVVVGGTVLGGGRGGLLGTVFGAYILMLVVNTLLVLNVSAFYSTIAEGVILLLAVLAGGLGAGSPLARNLRQAQTWLQARSQGLLARQRTARAPAVRLPPVPRPAALVSAAPATFWARHADTLRFTAPAWVGLVVVAIATQYVLGRSLASWGYVNSLLVLASVLVVLALGQGGVILTGGLDLSIPWTIGLCGILLAGMVKGSDAALLYALPVTLGIGVLIGLLNGAGIVLLGISPIVMTLAANGILQGLAMLYSKGTPDGFASPLLRRFMTDQSLLVTPVVLFVVVFVVAAVLLLGRTGFGRSLYAVGNGQRVATLSGVRVGRTIIGVYMLSGLCSALAAVLLTGLSGQASLGMGDEYLLPSIAVVVIGGTLIVGGRGHYLGMLGGVLMLTALQTLLAGTTLPYASRSILFGLVVLAAVIGLRERRA